MESFGDPFKIANAYRTKLEDWSKIKTGSDLLLLSDYLKQLQSAMKTNTYLSGLNDCLENQRILRKLPDWVVTRWSRIVQQDRSSNAYPGFAGFSDFMAQEAKVAFDPIASVQALRGKTNDTNDPKPKDTSKASKKVKSKSLNTCSEETQKVNKGDNGSKPTEKQSDQTHKSDPKKTPNKGPVASSSGNQKQDKSVSRNCYFCSEQHFLSRCKEFRKLTPKDRIQFLRGGRCASGAWARGTSPKIVKRL